MPVKMRPTAKPIEVRKMTKALALGARAPALIPGIETVATFQ
jgi:hypothetical protein